MRAGFCSPAQVYLADLETLLRFAAPRRVARLNIVQLKQKCELSLPSVFRAVDLMGGSVMSEEQLAQKRCPLVVVPWLNEKLVRA